MAENTNTSVDIKGLQSVFSVRHTDTHDTFSSFNDAASIPQFDGVQLFVACLPTLYGNTQPSRS